MPEQPSRIITPGAWNARKFILPYLSETFSCLWPPVGSCAIRPLRTGNERRFETFVRSLALELDLFVVPKRSKSCHLDDALQQKNNCWNGQLPWFHHSNASRKNTFLKLLFNLSIIYLMYENVLTSVIRCDEAPSLGDVEPFAAASALFCSDALISHATTCPTGRAWNKSNNNFYIHGFEKFWFFRIQRLLMRNRRKNAFFCWAENPS